MQIIVVGCGKVGLNLATSLVRQGHDVVIVESDSKLLQSAADLECIRILGVPIDRDVLRNAGIETADILCAMTQNDNINIMVSQIADEIFKVPKIITRIFNPENRLVFDEFGLNTICSTSLTVEAVLRKIGGEKNEQTQRVYNTDVLYSSVPIDADLVGEDICNLSTDTGKLVFGLLRRSRLLLAVPGLKVLSGDELVLVDLQ
jgi:trk system potassium uptake protein TrkA